MKQHRVSNLGKESMFYIFFEALFHLAPQKKLRRGTASRHCSRHESARSSGELVPRDRARSRFASDRPWQGANRQDGPKPCCCIWQLSCNQAMFRPTLLKRSKIWRLLRCIKFDNGINIGPAGKPCRSRL